MCAKVRCSEHEEISECTLVCCLAPKSHGKKQIVFFFPNLDLIKKKYWNDFIEKTAELGTRDDCRDNLFIGPKKLSSVPRYRWKLCRNSNFNCYRQTFLSHEFWEVDALSPTRHVIKLPHSQLCKKLGVRENIYHTLCTSWWGASCWTVFICFSTEKIKTTTQFPSSIQVLSISLSLIWWYSCILEVIFLSERSHVGGKAGRFLQRAILKQRGRTAVVLSDNAAAGADAVTRNYTRLFAEEEQRICCHLFAAAAAAIGDSARHLAANNGTMEQAGVEDGGARVFRLTQRRWLSRAHQAHVSERLKGTWHR